MAICKQFDDLISSKSVPTVHICIGHPEKKLQSPKWHWLFLPPIGANGYDTTYVGKTKNANLFEGLTYAQELEMFDS